MSTKASPPPWHRPDTDAAKQVSANAILAFVLAVGGWIMFAMSLIWVFVALEVVAFLMGITARREIDRGRLSGRVFASLAISLPVLAAVVFGIAKIEPHIIPWVEQLKDVLAV